MEEIAAPTFTRYDILSAAPRQRLMASATGIVADSIVAAEYQAIEDKIGRRLQVLRGD